MLLQSGGQQWHRACSRHPSEMMAILIHFNQSCYRTFNHFYTQYVSHQLR